MTTQTFEAFAFAESLTRALTQCGYSTPTPIQVQALPPQLEGRDLLGMAETGSGKTAAFLLPLLNEFATNLSGPSWKQVSALVMAPTRELAVQIDQEVAKLSRNMDLRRTVVLGGVSKGPQISALKRGVHILIATPGRLIDHVNMRNCDLSGVQTLVIDEADRMFDMGFIRDIKKIVSLIPQKRRTALFSATMPDEIKKFACDILRDPCSVDLSSKEIVVDRIDQKIMIVRTPEKQSRLHTILGNDDAKRVIVFTRTKHGADRVANRLGMAGISAVAFHGNKTQNARQRALNDFTMGNIRVLVATDIAARGIDVSNITHVINFDMPLDPETYVHRVGRTARKGTNGIAISLCDPSEHQEVRAIERMMKQPLKVISDVGGEALPALPHRYTQQTGESSHRDHGCGGRDGKHGHRDGGSRQERCATNGCSPDSGDLHNINNSRRDDRSRAPARGMVHAAYQNEGNIDRPTTMFGVSDRGHPAPRSTYQKRPHRDSEGSRQRDYDHQRTRRPHNSSGGGCLCDQNTSDHHHPKDHNSENGNDHRHAPLYAEGRYRKRSERHPSQGSSCAEKASRSWGNAATPKFMKRP